MKNVSGLRKFAKEHQPRRSSWYATALRKIDKEKAKKAAEKCPQLEGRPCFAPECETDCQRPGGLSPK